MKDISELITDNLPLHHSLIFENERVASVRSAFGYQASSFLISILSFYKDEVW